MTYEPTGNLSGHSADGETKKAALFPLATRETLDYTHCCANQPLMLFNCGKYVFNILLKVIYIHDFVWSRRYFRTEGSLKDPVAD